MSPATTTSKPSPHKTRPRGKPLTNLEKVAASNATRALQASKVLKAARKPQNKPKTLPPPEEMEEIVRAAETKLRMKKISAATRNRKGTFTNAEKISKAKVTAAAAAASARKKGMGNERRKEVVGEGLEMKGRRERVVKSQSTFSVVMGQSGEGGADGGAFVGSEG